MTTAFFTDERFSAHTLQGHPEHAGRLESVIKLYKSEGVWDKLFRVAATPATDEQILRVHTPKHIERLQLIERLDQPTFFEADTYVVPESNELARVAAGGVIAVVDEVIHGKAENGIAAVRPPGHHATPTRAMGFCLLSNIAIAARAVHNIDRIAIVDYDVHHGNGTQDALYEDPSILFMSSHQSPLYPGTGAIGEIGTGAGKGFTANVPLPPGTGDEAIMELYEKFLWPLLRRFQPQLILVSAGFDAHWRDPLANLLFSLKGFDHISRELLKMAQELCGGKIVFVMEGGYDLEVLSHGWLNIATMLLGSQQVSDPIGTYRGGKSLPAGYLDNLLKIHNL